MIVPPLVSWLNATSDMIDNSPLSGYKFGDEIKGHYMDLIDEENMTFAIYTADRKYTNMLPPVMIAVNFIGDTELGYGTATVKFTVNSFGYSRWTKPEALITVNPGGYKGQFTFEYELYYDYLNVKNEPISEPDEKLEIVFDIDEYGTVDLLGN